MSRIFQGQQSYSNHQIIHAGSNDLILDRTSQDITTSTVNLAGSVKSKNCHVSISNIILRNENKKISQKSQEVNTHLKELCEEKNLYLIDNNNKIKEQHLNEGKLHLNKRGYNILSSDFISKLSKILNLQRDKNKTGFNAEECNSDKTSIVQKVIDGNRVLKSVRCTYLNKLVFAHLNISSIRNKSELLSE